MQRLKNIYISIWVFSFILLSFLIYNIQSHIETYSHQYQRIEDFKYLPSGKFLKGAALSYDSLLADLLWIKTIGYFGHHALTDRNYEWFYHIIDITTILDPYYHDPYEFGGIVLATEIGDLDYSISILKKGLRNIPKTHPRYWYIPFYLAFDYMFYKEDFKTAAQYLEQAAKMPGSPSYLPLLAARLYANAQDPDIAIAFLREMMNSTESIELKDQLDYRIKEVMADRDIRILEKARDEFNLRWKRFPQKIDELVEYGILPEIPKDPFGGNYYISKEDNSIQTDSMLQKLDIDINKKAMQYKVGVIDPNEKKRSD